MEVEDKIITDFFTTSGKNYKLNLEETAYLCTESQLILLNEPTLLELKSPITICGDIHGHLLDLLHVFQLSGTPPEKKYLFLGDYIDRGPQVLEVISLLLALKIKYPNQIYLLRGNHETLESDDSNFFEICSNRISSDSISLFRDLFNSLPLAAIVDKKIFCVHGGISPNLNNLNDIRRIIRPISIPNSGIITDLVWSDPNPQIFEWGSNKRGQSCYWGLKVAKIFMENNQLTHIIRAHQVVFEGFSYPFYPDKSVITIYTATSSGHANFGSFISIENGNLEVIKMPPLASNSTLTVCYNDNVNIKIKK